MIKNHKYFLITSGILLAISASPAFSMQENKDKEKMFKKRFKEEQRNVEEINNKIDSRLNIGIKKKNTKK